MHVAAFAEAKQSTKLFEHNTGGITGVGLYQQRITMSGRVFAQNHGFTQASSTIENVDLTIQVRQANDLNTLAGGHCWDITRRDTTRLFLVGFAGNEAAGQFVDASHIPLIFSLQVLINHCRAFTKSAGYLCLAVTLAGHKFIQFCL